MYVYEKCTYKVSHFNSFSKKLFIIHNYSLFEETFEIKLFSVIKFVSFPRF